MDPTFPPPADPLRHVLAFALVPPEYTPFMTTAAGSTAAPAPAPAPPASAAQGAGPKRPPGPPPNEPAETIDDPRVLTFDVGPADARWRVFVGLPRVPAPAGGYSAIVTSDGNATFPLFWHARERLAPDAPVVLVAVGYPTHLRFDMARRWYDLAARFMLPADRDPGTVRGPGANRTGGRAAFLAMVWDEALPEACRRARIRLDMADLTLHGHSLGALFAAYVLCRRPRRFARYVAADPSAWYNEGEVVRDAEVFAAGLAAAGAVVAPPIRLHVAASGSWAAWRHPSAAPQFAPRDIAAALDGAARGLTITYRSHPDDNHSTLIPTSVEAALLIHLGRDQDASVRARAATEAGS